MIQTTKAYVAFAASQTATCRKAFQMDVFYCCGDCWVIQARSISTAFSSITFDAT